MKLSQAVVSSRSAAEVASRRLSPDESSTQAMTLAPRAAGADDTPPQSQSNDCSEDMRLSDAKLLDATAILHLSRPATMNQALVLEGLASGLDRPTDLLWRTFSGNCEKEISMVCGAIVPERVDWNRSAADGATLAMKVWERGAKSNIDCLSRIAPLEAYSGHDATGRTMLHYAVARNAPECLAALLQKHPLLQMQVLSSSTYPFHVSPMRLAIEHGYRQAAKVLCGDHRVVNMLAPASADLMSWTAEQRFEFTELCQQCMTDSDSGMLEFLMRLMPSELLSAEEAYLLVSAAAKVDAAPIMAELAHYLGDRLYLTVDNQPNVLQLCAGSKSFKLFSALLDHPAAQLLLQPESRHYHLPLFAAAENDNAENFLAIAARLPDPYLIRNERGESVFFNMSDACIGGVLEAAGHSIPKDPRVRYDLTYQFLQPVFNIDQSEYSPMEMGDSKELYENGFALSRLLADYPDLLDVDLNIGGRSVRNVFSMNFTEALETFATSSREEVEESFADIDAYLADEDSALAVMLCGTPDADVPSNNASREGN